MTDVNLNDVEKHFDLTIASKKLEDPEDAKIRRFKDKWLFIATLIALAVMYIVCIVFIVTNNPRSPYVGNALNGVIGW